MRADANIGARAFPVWEPACRATSSGEPSATIAPAGVAALGPQVDDPVGGLDHVEVVLDDDDRVPLLDQAVQHLEQHAHVLEVEAGGRLVEDVEGAAGVPLGQLGRELDALRLAARERRRALAEVDVAEAHVVQRLELGEDPRLVLEELERLGHGEVQHVGDVLPLEADLERLAVVAAPVAHVARHVDVGQEVHLDLHQAVALAGLAAAALHVEGEAAGAVAAHLRLRQLGEQVADRREEPGVGGGVGARRAADRALVDVDDLVHELEPFDPVVIARG